MLNRVAVCKFLPESLPSNPLPSSSTRSASATPSDIQSSGQGRSSSRTPLVVRPGFAFPSPLPSQHINPPTETPIIEVEASLETDTNPVLSSPPFVPLSEIGSSS
ncbi:hypothetical protein Salat_1190500 [Sesamum alatum]|uniref:Uncharacterized protein n=1 Tax=Sesamum alatum TaxID=300844 RepID=A0AAE1YEP1_9LAMI|nr:hypothetical protein Salat_1190500 [Sesamum alatum]